LLSPSASLTDADDTELNFAAVQITAGSFPGDGDTLTVNGATSGTVTGITFTWNPTLHALVLTGASSVANYQALLQTVQFQSTSDNPTGFNASPQRTLTWFVSDGTAVTTATTTLAITAVNDAPINTVPGAQTVAEDATLSIVGVSVADSDSSTLTTTLSVAHGTLNVTAGAGVSGNGTTSVAITGTAAQINAALAGLAYTGNLNFNGADTLTVATNDGTATDTDTIAITVNPVNDAPINTVPGAQTVAEDTILPIAGVSVADIDSSALSIASSALTTTLSVANGILNVTAGPGVTGNGTASVTIAGTAAQINTALAGLAYAGNLNFNGADTLTVATSDGTATDTDTIAITVTPVNIFEASTFELPAFGPGAGNWISDDLYPRELADVNGDGMADIVGFAQPGVLVSLATGDGHFAPSTFELPAFGPNAGGWSSDNTYPREVADVNGDGKADIVGFASTGVFVSLATGDGHFAPPIFDLPAFGPDAGGWSSDDTYPRELADVNGGGGPTSSDSPRLESLSLSPTNFSIDRGPHVEVNEQLSYELIVHRK
jgi:VCBS repeat-containing protein